MDHQNSSSSSATHLSKIVKIRKNYNHRTLVPVTPKGRANKRIRKTNKQLPLPQQCDHKSINFNLILLLSKHVGKYDHTIYERSCRNNVRWIKNSDEFYLDNSARQVCLHVIFLHSIQHCHMNWWKKLLALIERTFVRVNALCLAYNEKHIVTYGYCNNYTLEYCQNFFETLSFLLDTIVIKLLNHTKLYYVT